MIKFALQDLDFRLRTVFMFSMHYIGHKRKKCGQTEECNVLWLHFYLKPWILRDIWMQNKADIFVHNQQFVVYFTTAA